MNIGEPCNLQLYKSMEIISANCSRVLNTDNRFITGNSTLQCRLVSVYFMADMSYIILLADSTLHASQYLQYCRVNQYLYVLTLVVV